MAAAMVVSPMAANAQSDDARLTSASATVETVAATPNTIVFYDDADQKASEWVADRPDRVAVSIRYGGATTFAPADIERVLSHDFTENGVGHAVYYWEYGGETSGTSIAIETDDAIFGPYTLGDIRKEIPEVSRRINFNAGIGLQASLN